MTITNERAELLAQYLNADADRAKKLFETEVEKAVEIINDDGYDFGVEELQEFDLALQYVAARSSGEVELTEDSLENITGGLGVLEAIGIIGGAVAACEWALNKGYKIGTWIGKKIFR